jgi:aminomethyltransferase
MELQRTALYAQHLELGARMVPFAGFEMPLRYFSETEEHLNVRRGVGLFDVSHMGEFLLRGPRALELIQTLCSNDAARLTPGKAQYSCLPNEQGGIVDDLLVYMMRENEYMLVVNASNIGKDWTWIAERNHGGVTMENISDQVSLIAVQGPKAVDVLQKLTQVDLRSIPYYSFAKGNLLNITGGAILSATGYTGSGGFELFVYNEYAPQVWKALFEAGAEYGIRPAGLGARDTLRLEMGYCLYGNDIDDQTSPIEAGLGWITKFTKAFTNSEKLKNQKEQGPARRLVGFEMTEKGIPRHDYTLLSAEGASIGRVTSGTMAPSLEKGIGMGYVESAYAAAGTELAVDIRGRAIKARVCSMPFYRPPQTV